MHNSASPQDLSNDGKVPVRTVTNRGFRVFFSLNIID